MAIDEDLAAYCDAQSRRIFQMLWLHVGDHHVAEELAQDTLVKICQHWSRVRRMENIDGWVTTTALSMARSWWRRRYAERRTKRRAAAGPLGIEPSDAAGAIALRNAVAELPRRQREAIILRYWADLSVDATAQARGCATGTVKALTSQAINTLRSQDLGLSEGSSSRG